MDRINLAVRLIIIKNKRVLLINNRRDNFYYFIGGKVNPGETIEAAAKREIEEEACMDINIRLVKPLYIYELIREGKQKHKFELFYLAEIDKYEELEGVEDPEHDGSDNLTWVELRKLPSDVLPEFVAERIYNDSKNKFSDIQIPFESSSR